MTEAEVKVLIMGVVNSKYRTSALCDEKHGNMEEGMQELKDKQDSMNTKGWAIIALLLCNLVGMISWLIRTA